ncbi:hypothetical protein ACFSLT_27270 [Novosphingobium resinovorum]
MDGRARTGFARGRRRPHRLSLLCARPAPCARPDPVGAAGTVPRDHRRQGPGADHGADVDASGNGAVESQRLYQLVRMQGGMAERTFAIEFLDPGVQAYAFTFG